MSVMELLAKMKMNVILVILTVLVLMDLSVTMK